MSRYSTSYVARRRAHAAEQSRLNFHAAEQLKAFIVFAGALGAVMAFVLGRVLGVF